MGDLVGIRFVEVSAGIESVCGKPQPLSNDDVIANIGLDGVLLRISVNVVAVGAGVV